MRLRLRIASRSERGERRGWTYSGGSSIRLKANGARSVRGAFVVAGHESCAHGHARSAAECQCVLSGLGSSGLLDEGLVFFAAMVPTEM